MRASMKAPTAQAARKNPCHSEKMWLPCREAGRGAPIDGVVLPVRPRDAEQHREPAPRAELSFLLQRPLEQQHVALVGVVPPLDLRDAVHEDLEVTLHVARNLDLRLRSHLPRMPAWRRAPTSSLPAPLGTKGASRAG